MNQSAATARPAAYDEARSLVRAAEFTKAAALLDEQEAAGARDAAGVLLRARIHLVWNPATALVYLAERSGRLRTKAHRAEAALLSGAAYARLGDDGSARARFRAAAPLCAGRPDLRADLAYQQAAAAWIRRRLDAAERLLARADWRGAAATVLIQRDVLAGAIHGSRGQFSEQAAVLLQALQFIREQPEPSVLHWAHVVSQIAYLARELHGPGLKETAYEELARVPWTGDLADTHFTALRAVGWCHALEGDYFNAFRRLKEASAVAPSPAWRVMSLCDRSYLATCLGESRWAEQERSDARDLAATIKWNALEGEERFALCLLAELYAEHDPAVALSHIAEYRKAGRRFAAVLASADDRRVIAMESYSLGVVQKNLGDAVEASRLLTEAFEIYEAAGYRWRAGRAAKVLAELTGDADWASRAADALSAFPRSWLASPAVPARQPALRLASLTPAQQAVYELLARGLSTREIATRLHRSEYTVRNHVKAIFKAVGVRSRAALVAQAAEAKTGPA